MTSDDPWAERRAVSESEYERDPGRLSGSESGFARWFAPSPVTSTGANLVEIGCGPGRDVCHYARQGYHVLGIDHAANAVQGAGRRVTLLPEPARSRARIVEGEATAALRALAPGSQDAVVAHLVYGSLTPDELRQIEGLLRTVLRPGGLHAFAVRSTRDPRFKVGERVGPDTVLGGPHLVAHRYFTAATAAEILGPSFELDQREVRRADHLIFIRGRLNSPTGRPSASL